MSPRWLVALLMASVLTAEPPRISGRAMGTTWSVAYRPAVPANTADELSRRVAARLEALEQIFSTYRAQSEVARFNAAAAREWFEVSPELAHTARESRAVSELTRGAFDVTVAPLVALWGFGPNGTAASMPTERAIDATRARVDFRRVEARTAPPGLRRSGHVATVDFSSMAKGFAADEVSALLVEVGVVDHLVQVGGDVKAGGKSGWRVGIEDPRPQSRTPVEVVELTGGAALSTSGNHRNVRLHGGRWLGHIIDPRTGRPVESDVMSVSVRHPSGASSSALATGLFVLGVEEGLAVAEANGLAALYLVDVRGELRTRATSHWSGK